MYKSTKKLIKIPTENNQILKQVLDLVNSNEELQTLWRVNNINAIDRMGYNDHGPLHFQIVSNIALRIIRILEKKKIKMSVTENYGFSLEYAEVVVF